MNELEQAKLQRLIDLMIEVRLILQQMLHTTDELEKELRIHLNRTWDVIK